MTVSIASADAGASAIFDLPCASGLELLLQLLGDYADGVPLALVLGSSDDCISTFARKGTRWPLDELQACKS